MTARQRSVMAALVLAGAVAGYVAHDAVGAYPQTKPKAGQLCKAIHVGKVAVATNGRKVRCTKRGRYSRWVYVRKTAQQTKQPTPTTDRRPLPPAPPIIYGRASAYGPGLWGNRTACGQVLTRSTLGVAHRTYPCGTRLTLIAPSGRTVTVRVIDRGPFIRGRYLDLTERTVQRLGFSSARAFGVRTVGWRVWWG